MKKVLAVAVISLGLTLPATAQFTQGKILATGGIEFTTGSSSLETDSTDETLFSSMSYGINVGGGYFFADNIAAGISLGYGSATLTIDPDDENAADLVSSQFNWGVFGRYYMPYSDRFAMFGELGVGMANISETFDGDDIASGSAFSVGLGAGMNYMVSDMFFLEMNYGFLGYNSLSMTNEFTSTTETTSEFGLLGDLSSLSLGMTLLF